MSHDSKIIINAETSFFTGDYADPLFTTPLTRGIILYRLGTDRVVAVNDIALREIGRSREEILAAPGRELWGDDGRDVIRRIYPRMEMTDRSILWGQPLPLNSADGKSGLWFCSLSLLDCGPGEIRVCLESPDAEIRFQPFAKSPLRAFAVHALQGCLWELDIKRQRFHYGRDNRVLFGIEGLPGNPGLTVQECLAKIHPDDTTQIVHRWRQLVTRGIRAINRYRVSDGAGGWRWVHSVIHAVINDRGGEPALALGLNLDITDDLAGEGSYLDLQNRLRLIFENADIGMAIGDPDGGVLTNVNPAMAVLFGRNREDFEDRPLTDFLPEKECEEFAACLKRLSDGQYGRVFHDCRLERPDGREVWVKMTLTLSRENQDRRRNLILLIEDVTALRASQEKLLYEASHDALTGLLNRGTVLRRLEEYIHLSLRQGQPLSFCMADLDNFKLVNDRHGHQSGDQVLRRFAEMLGEILRDTDLAGRYGGEEFCVVFPGTTPEGAGEAMERLRDRLGGEVFRSRDMGNFRITATFGIASLEQFNNIRDLIAGADAALYRGKKAGRNRVVLSDKSSKSHRSIRKTVAGEGCG